MKTTNKLFKSQVQEHILGALDEELNTVEEQLQNVVEGFHNWYGRHEQKMVPNHQEAFVSWMNGLPSEFNTEYTNYGIHTTLKEWFENCEQPYKDQPEDKEAKLYNNLVYREFNTLLKKNNLRLF